MTLSRTIGRTGTPPGASTDRLDQDIRADAAEALYPARPRTLRAGRTRPRGPVRRFAAVVGPPVLLVVLFVGCWQWMATSVDSPLVPTVAAVWNELVELAADGVLLDQIWATLVRVLLGFALAFGVAVVVGIAMGRSVLIRRFLQPAVLIGLVTPGLVKALLCVIWFGISLWNPVLAVALAAAPALILNITEGVRSVDPGLIEMAHVYRLPLAVRLRRLWLPALSPAMFAGARLGIALSWKVIVLIEIFGMADGVGYQLNLEFSQNNVAGVLAWTFAFIVVMAAIEYGIFQTLEGRSLRWRREVSI